jgi:hypothetical protein
MQQELVDALTQQLIDLVEPNTRFDRASLPLVSAATNRCSVTGAQVYRVAFGAQSKSGRGKLPAGARHAGNSEIFRAALDRATEANRLALAARLRRWLANQAELPGTALGGADCHDGEDAIGYEHECQPCHGRGEVRCGSCSGAGSANCTNCHGSGQGNCWSCSGSGQKACSRCNGSGSIGENRERRRANYADNREWTEYYVEYVTCSSCGGQRQLRCTSCSSGKVSCTICSASGRVQCGACSGSGKVSCAGCDGTGTLHEIGTQTCDVSQTLALQTNAEDEEARQTIESLGTLERLCSLTRAQLRGAAVSADSVTRQIEAQMMLTAVSVRVAQQQLDIRGYGDQAHVFNFKNIVGTLLDTDLQELEHALSNGSWLPLRPVPALDAALGGFLLSEINSKIGHVAGARRAALGDFANRELRGAVSVSYVQRAAKALRSAVTRTYNSEIVIPAAVAAFLPAISLVVVPLLNNAWRGINGWLTLLMAVCAGGAAELWAVSRLRKRFMLELAPKAIALLRTTRTLWWWRLVMLLGMVAVIVLFAAVGSRLEQPS